MVEREIRNVGSKSEWQQRTERGKGDGMKKKSGGRQGTTEVIKK